MKENLFLSFLYGSVLGRGILKILTKPVISKLCGKVMDSKISALVIPYFIKKNNIDMSEYEKKKYTSFNDFFTRKIKMEKRPIDYINNHFTSPCDGYLSIYNINSDTTLPIKKSKYTVSELINDEEIAKEYENGFCLVFRLCPDHYHRYNYIDKGLIIAKKHIDGILHTVRPIACKKFNVYTENTREYTLIDTENFGKILQMEIGAMMVGKIDNYDCDNSVNRGQEKGKFLFGGSTIVILIKPEIISLKENLEEVEVKIGQWIYN